MTALIVDLDHTLIDTDLLFESSLGVLKSRPWLLAIYPFWFARGKGFLKNELVKRFEIDASALPYRTDTLNYILKRKKTGDKIILATASHQHYADKVAAYLGVFDDVMASDKTFNLSSHHKARKLVERFGAKNFDYMGDHARDLPVWAVSNLAILVNVSDQIIRKTSALNTLLISKKSLN